MSDPMETMRAGLDAAHAAADQLVREAESRARSSFEDLPPAGWAAPGSEAAPNPDLRAIVALIDGVRELVTERVPDELSERIALAVRELLLAVRALIDWYLDRLERPASPSSSTAASRVEDIPID